MSVIKYQTSPICTAVGAIPGAMPPLIGYAGASGHITWGALVRYSRSSSFGKFPHFYAIAWMYREDYGRVWNQDVAGNEAGW